MRSYTCVRKGCYHEIIADTTPESPKWNDGHVCTFKPTAELFLERSCREKMGFLREVDVDAIASDEQLRLQPCLVRCNRCRFTTPAQDVKWLIECVKKNGDWCRDVSVPANDPIWQKLGLR